MLTLNNIPRSADDEQGSGPVEEVERKQIAKRLWIDDAGAEVENVEDATGVSYEFLGRTKGGVTVPPDGKVFTVHFRDMSEAEKNMLAGFGAHTLMGNVTNTWLGEKGEKQASAHDAIAERFELLKSGQWVDRTREVGAKIDQPTLAQAWLQVRTNAGKTGYDLDQLLDMIQKDTLVKPDGSKVPGLVAALRRDPNVSSAYAALRGRTVVDAAALLD